MAQAIAEIRRERSIRGLVDNLFVFAGQTEAVDRRRAAEALLRANPQLRDRANFRAGTRVVIPADLGLRTTDRVRRPGVSLAGLIDDGSARLVQAEAAITAGLQRRSAETRDALARLSDRDFVVALRAAEVPDGLNRARAALALLREEEAAREGIQEALVQAVESATAELARLRELTRDPRDD